jgi:nitrogen fixation NifU-like protein
MSEIQELYQELILDHNRRPRNFQKLAGANRTAEGYNRDIFEHLREVRWTQHLTLL